MGRQDHETIVAVAYDAAARTLVVHFMDGTVASRATGRIDCEMDVVGADVYAA